MIVRTRFAPSPTGFLHIGGVRTALFSWLFARHFHGEFVLRIEDTDRERSTQESVQAIIEALSWLGLTWDLGPFYQSERYQRYQEIAEQLLQENKAYCCECSKERLEHLRETQLAAKKKPRYDGRCRDKNLIFSHKSSQVIRFNNPPTGSVLFSDEVYGDISVNNSELDDMILIRSDGSPTYNFAVVIDDVDMQITHVIRGDDHINNTPRQINLFKALKATIPTFAHLPMILGEDGKRLSKRHGAVSVLQFKELGYLPEALLNSLVRLGWSHGDQEIFTLGEMIKYFNLKNVNRGASNFSYEKLNWLNQHYLRNNPPEKIAQQLQWHFNYRNLDLSQGPNLVDLIPLQAERCKTLEEICEKSFYFYQDQLEYNEEAVKKFLRPVVLLPLEALYERFNHLKVWDKNTIQTCINEVSAGFDMNMGKIAQPLRVATTGNSMSPAIDLTLSLLGKKRTLERLRYGLDLIRRREHQV